MIRHSTPKASSFRTGRPDRCVPLQRGEHGPVRTTLSSLIDACRVITSSPALSVPSNGELISAHSTSALAAPRVRTSVATRAARRTRVIVPSQIPATGKERPRSNSSPLGSQPQDHPRSPPLEPCVDETRRPSTGRRRISNTGFLGRVGASSTICLACTGCLLYNACIGRYRASGPLPAVTPIWWLADRRGRQDEDASTRFDGFDRAGFRKVVVAAAAASRTGRRVDGSGKRDD